MENEEWRDVVGYEGFYQVSSLGRVRSLSRYIFRTGRNGELHSVYRSARLLTPKSRGLYLAIDLRDPSGMVRYSIHRLVASAFCKGVVQDFVNHKDEDKHNNKADNLEWCTASYNQRYSKGSPIYLSSPHGTTEYFASRAEASEKTGMALCSVWRLTTNPSITVKGWRVALFAV